MIDKIVKNKMTSKIFDPLFNKETKNIDIIIDAIKHMISDSDMDMLMYMICTPDYVPLQLEDIVKWKPESYEIKDTIELDRMKDAGLMDKDGFIYGRIINSSNYGDSFNPFYYEMKIDAFLLNKKGEISFQEMSARTLRLHKLRIHSEDLPDMVWERVIKDLGS
jgi:hypothetical protein